MAFGRGLPPKGKGKPPSKAQPQTQAQPQMQVGPSPMAPPGPQSVPPPMPQPLTAPGGRPGFAEGTPNIPAPGQTVTNGSWTGPTPQPPPQPSPLGGQNQNLRQSLGLGVKRFASGTSDAQAAQDSAQANLAASEPSGLFNHFTTRDRSSQMFSYDDGPSRFIDHQDMSNAGRSPPGYGPHHIPTKAPGYASGTPNVFPQGVPQTGHYATGTPNVPATPVDEHFVAHLRAAMGMAPKQSTAAGPAHFASGTPDAGGGDIAAQPTFLDRLVHGSALGGAVRVGTDALQQQGPARPSLPGPVAAQPGGSTPANQTGFNAYQGPGVDISQLWARPTPQNPIDGPVKGSGGAAATGFNAYQGPVQEPINAPKQVAPLAQGGAAQAPQPLAQGNLNPLMQVMAGAPAQYAHSIGPDGVPFTKPVGSPAVNHVAQATGTPINVVNAMMHPELYSPQEFAHTIGGLSKKTIQDMWNMQHYLTPQQQALPQYIQHQQQYIDAAKGSDHGASQAQLDEYAKQAQASINDVLYRNAIPGQTYALPNQQTQQ